MPCQIRKIPALLPPTERRKVSRSESWIWRCEYTGRWFGCYETLETWATALQSTSSHTTSYHLKSSGGLFLCGAPHAPRYPPCPRSPSMFRRPGDSRRRLRRPVSVWRRIYQGLTDVCVAQLLRQRSRFHFNTRLVGRFCYLYRFFKRSVSRVCFLFLNESQVTRAVSVIICPEYHLDILNLITAKKVPLYLWNWCFNGINICGISQILNSKQCIGVCSLFFFNSVFLFLLVTGFHLFSNKWNRF